MSTALLTAPSLPIEAGEPCHPHRRPRPGRLLAAAVSAVTIAATVAVAGLSGTADAADPLISQGKPATASSTENAGTPAAAAVDGNTGTRWSQRVQRPAVAPGRPRRHRHHHPGRAALGGRVRAAFQIQTSADGTAVDHDLHDHHRHRRHADAQRHRHRPLRPDVRHRPGHPVRLLAVGVPGLRHLRRRATGCGTTNAALNQPPPRRRPRTPAPRPSAAFDGNTGTRWSSASSDPQWLQVDLGSHRDHLPGRAELGGRVRDRLPDPDVARRHDWTRSTRPPPAPAAPRRSTVTGTGRYVRMNGTARATSTATRCGSSPCSPPAARHRRRPGGGDLGPNVHVFDPSMSTATIQSQLDAVFAAQESNQFGTRRDALLFKPGTYNVNANVGFYTSIMGLGQNPDDVNISGADRRRRLVRAATRPRTSGARRRTSMVPVGRHPVGGRAGRAVPPHGHPRRPEPGPDRLRLGHRRLHRRQPDRRHRRPVLAAAVVHPRQHHRRRQQRRLEHGLLRRQRRAGAELPDPPTPRSPPPRSAARSRTSTWTRPATTRCSCRPCGPTPPARPGRPAPPRAPRSR